jgi:hypothetical protein
LVLVILTMLGSLLACTLDVGGPEPPGNAIPIQPNSSAELEDAWRAALTDAALNGQITVILNETQLTAFINQRFQGGERPLITNPQIYLREGSILMYGVVERAILRGSILVTIQPEILPEGDLRFAISDASLGPVPAPEALLDALSAVLTEAFTGSVGSLATGIRVSSLAIDNGEMAIVGELR